MQELKGTDLRKIIRLLHDEELDYPISMSVLDGTFSGSALVDDPENPAKALILHQHIGFILYIGLKPDYQQAKQIAEAVISYRSDRHYCNFVEMANCPPAVEKQIRSKYPNARSIQRINWTHDPAFLSYAPEPVIPDGCRAAFLDSDLFENKFLRYETEMFWDSTDIFLKDAFGTVILDSDGEFMGVCGAVSASDGFYEINIEVKEAHRRKGIGYAVAYEFIKECHKRNAAPHWDCHEHNDGSQALAKKLGFKEAGRYPLLSWTY